MKDFTLTVTEGQLGVIGAGLGELPYKLAAPVMHALQAQVAAQTAKSAEVAVKPTAANDADASGGEVAAQ